MKYYFTYKFNTLNNRTIYLHLYRMHSMLEKYALNIIILLERYKSIICINKILIKWQIKHAQKNRKK